MILTFLKIPLCRIKPIYIFTFDWPVLKSPPSYFLRFLTLCKSRERCLISKTLFTLWLFQSISIHQQAKQEFTDRQSWFKKRLFIFITYIHNCSYNKSRFKSFSAFPILNILMRNKYMLYYKADRECFQLSASFCFIRIEFAAWLQFIFKLLAFLTFCNLYRLLFHLLRLVWSSKTWNNKI